MSSDGDGLPKAGEVVAGKYRIGEELGRGGMGVVQAATRLEDGVEVALKLLLQGGPSRAERFAREARIGARLLGTHVVRVFDYGVYQGHTPFLVMERLYGDDLKEAALRGGMPVAEACGYLMQACAGLVEAHAVGIIHRDLKPANLFLSAGTAGNHLKVLDFGIGKVFDELGLGNDLTETTALMGSPLYMPPERLRSGKEADPRGDIWALGSILFELLTGKAIFDGDTLPILCVNILNQPPRDVTQMRSDVPPQLGAIISRCMAKKKEDRYANVVELAAALMPFAGPHGPALLADVQASMAGAPPVSSQGQRFTGTVRMGDHAASGPNPALQAGAAARPVAPATAVLPATGAGQHAAAGQPVATLKSTPVVATNDGVTASAGAAPSGARWPLVVASVAVVAGALVAALVLLGDDSEAGSTAAANTPSPSATAAASPSGAAAGSGTATPAPATEEPDFPFEHTDGRCLPPRQHVAWFWLKSERKQGVVYDCLHCDTKHSPKNPELSPCVRVEPKGGWQTEMRCEKNVCSANPARKAPVRRSEFAWKQAEAMLNDPANSGDTTRAKPTRPGAAPPARQPRPAQPPPPAGKSTDDSFKTEH